MDRASVLSLVTADGDALLHHSAFNDDFDIVLAASLSSVDALLWASPRLRSDPAIMLSAVTAHGRSLRYTPTLRDDPAIVLAAVTADGDALQFACTSLRNDPAIVLAAVTQSPYALGYASESLRGDPAIVRAAVEQDWEAIRCATELAQQNPTVKQAVGKARGLAIAKQRQSDGTRISQKSNLHGGHGAHNSSRGRAFVTFLLAQFAPTRVLDVAGGNGEIAVRLNFCHHVPTAVIDPRAADFPKTLQTKVIPYLPKKWQVKLADKPQEELDDALKAHLPTQFMGGFDTGNKEIEALVADCTLMIGMHADNVTEPIVEAALKFDKSCAVTPCCVFPNLFKERKVDGRPVRDYDQFVKYLVMLHPSLKSKVLPFPGRNVCVYRYSRRLEPASWRQFASDYKKVAVIVGHGSRNQYKDVNKAKADLEDRLGDVDLIVWGGDEPDSPDSPESPGVGQLVKLIASENKNVCVCAVARKGWADWLSPQSPQNSWVTHVLTYEADSWGGVSTGGEAVGGTAFYCDKACVTGKLFAVGGGEIAKQEVAYCRREGWHVEYVRAECASGGGYGEVDGLFDSRPSLTT